MKDFRPRGDFGGGARGNNRGAFRGGGGFGQRSFNGPKQMFQAICADCNKTCEVPFRPNGEKPVYCRDCFGDSKTQGQGPGHSSDFSKNNYPKREAGSPAVFKPDPGVRQMEELKRQLDAVNVKLDKLLQKIDGANMQAAPAAATKESLGDMVSKAQDTGKRMANKKIKKIAAKKK